MANETKQFLSLSGLQEYDALLKQEIKDTLAQLPTTNIIHGDAKELLSNIIENYILNINYETLLAFDTSEIVTGATSTTSVLGQAILGQMVLA